MAPESTALGGWGQLATGSRHTRHSRWPFALKPCWYSTSLFNLRVAAARW